MSTGRPLPAELNYNHLYYFWRVAREGSVSRAAEQLMVSQPTVSIQLRSLEESLRVKLFQRAGRRLVLTEIGQTVYRYASEMFQVGQELLQSLARPGGAAGTRLLVGIADAVPKSLVHRVLSPALTPGQTVRFICREDKVQHLLADLAADRLDLVLGDAPLGASAHLRGMSFLLHECPLSFVAPPALARRLARGFPASLDAQPMLLPSDAAAVHAPLLEWLHRHRLRPEVIAEFDDAATMASFAQGATGVFPVPALVDREFRQQYECRLVGRVSSIVYRFYAVTDEHHLASPAIAAICAARQRQTKKPAQW